MRQASKYLWRRFKSQNSKASNLQRSVRTTKNEGSEDIAAYFLRVDETMNAIIGLGEEIEQSIIFQKILRSLPMRFNPKISTLEKDQI